MTDNFSPQNFASVSSASVSSASVLTEQPSGMCRFPHIQFTLLEKNGTELGTDDWENIFIPAHHVAAILFNNVSPEHLTALVAAPLPADPQDNIPHPSDNQQHLQPEPSLPEEAAPAHLADSEPSPPDRHPSSRSSYPSSQEIIGEIELVFPTKVILAPPEGTSAENLPTVKNRTLTGSLPDNPDDAISDTSIVVNGTCVTAEKFVELFVVAFQEMLWRTIKTFSQEEQENFVGGELSPDVTGNAFGEGQ